MKRKISGHEMPLGAPFKEREKNPSLENKRNPKFKNIFSSSLYQLILNVGLVCLPILVNASLVCIAKESFEKK